MLKKSSPSTNSRFPLLSVFKIKIFVAFGEYLEASVFKMKDFVAFGENLETLKTFVFKAKTFGAFGEFQVCFTKSVYEIFGIRKEGG